MFIFFFFFYLSVLNRVFYSGSSVIPINNTNNTLSKYCVFYDNNYNYRNIQFT